MKLFYLSLFLFIVTLILVIAINNMYATIDISNQAVNQVDDSVEGAVGWKQTALMYKMLYIIPFVFLVTTITSFIKIK